MIPQPILLGFLPTATGKRVARRSITQFIAQSSVLLPAEKRWLSLSWRNCAKTPLSACSRVRRY